MKYSELLPKILKLISGNSWNISLINLSSGPNFISFNLSFRGIHGDTELKIITDQWRLSLEEIIKDFPETKFSVNHFNDSLYVNLSF